MTQLQMQAELDALIARVPFVQFLGVHLRHEDEALIAVLPFRDDLIGNPALPALHGGGTAALLEITAVVALGWSGLRNGQPLETLPKTIDLTVDYLRPGLSQEAYAQAQVNRAGRRYASVHVEAWQEDRDRLFAQATGHFLMPGAHG